MKSDYEHLMEELGKLTMYDSLLMANVDLLKKVPGTSDIESAVQLLRTSYHSKIQVVLDKLKRLNKESEG